MAKLVPNVIPNCAAVASVTLIGITAAIWAWQPVILFIGASVLGRDYGGHWLVVRGFMTNSEGITWADAYDRDQNPYNSSAHPDGAITIPLATFSDALTKELDTDNVHHKYSSLHEERSTKPKRFGHSRCAQTNASDPYEVSAPMAQEATGVD